MTVESGVYRDEQGRVYVVWVDNAVSRIFELTGGTVGHIVWERPNIRPWTGEQTEK